MNVHLTKDIWCDNHSRDLAALEKESDIFRCDWIVCELCDVMFDLPYIYICYICGRFVYYLVDVGFP